ncbi:MAG: hypothetical protein A4E28_02512 [Methanocella sp. PtaU1.Bin125]|nr:MAG: hypothetical protein A4E28_02512 [Methanocella sp. PtaU1.Bin125]
MESFSIRADCPYPDQLLETLWPKLAEYCEYEVFEYARGRVVTIAFEKYYPRSLSYLLVAATLDFTGAGTCQIDILAGGGREGTTDFAFGSEKRAVTDVIRIFTDICEAKGWDIREDESERISERVHDGPLRG